MFSHRYKLAFNSFNKKNIIFSLLFVFIGFNSIGQSVIEVADPFDADVILLSVNNKEDADIVVYKTNKKRESKKWDCMWLFKKWGFSDLSLFIYTDINDTSLYVDEDQKYRINGKVFFTKNIDERGYTNPNTTIEGLIRKSTYQDTTNLLVEVKNDSVISLNKDSVNAIIPKSDISLNNDSVNAIVPKSDSLDIKVPDPLITTDNVNIVFKVQVGACHRQIPEKELHKRYPGNKQISIEMHDGWYKYLIGNYSKYSEAKQEKLSTGTADAWVVVYKNNKRVPISEVINFLSYFTNSKLLILMLS